MDIVNVVDFSSATNARRVARFVIFSIIALAFLPATAGATEVINGSDSRGRALRIENLEALDDQQEPALFDVRFILSTPRILYGEPFPSETYAFDFNSISPNVEANRAILNALYNYYGPYGPVFFGPTGFDGIYFIPWEYRSPKYFVGSGSQRGSFAGELYECRLPCRFENPDIPRTFAKLTKVEGNNPPPDPDSRVDLSGTVIINRGRDIVPVCALVLASGRVQYSCDGGAFSLKDLPRDSDGSVTRQVYANGFYPNIDKLSDSADEIVYMQRSEDCPNYNEPYTPDSTPESNGKRIDISGRVSSGKSGAAVCALVLANGQFMFSCDGSGAYELNVPLDNNGQFQLQVYAANHAPQVQTFDESRPMNDVRMTSIFECQWR